jgi:hypothetical protein
MTYFEIYYRLNKEIPKKFSDRIFKESSNFENFKDFDKLDLIKMTHLLSRYQEFGNSKTEAVEGLNTVTKCLLNTDLSELKRNELETIILNLSYKQVNPNIELFTNLEPYVLKYLPEYSLQSLVNIFSAYIRSFCGTNFFLQTLGFTISSQLSNCNIIDLNVLLELSEPRFFNRPELSIYYSDFFNEIIGYIMMNINELKFKNYQNLLNGMINLGISNKKFNQIICTNFLRHHEGIGFSEYIKYLNLFSRIDTDSEVFWKKCLETLNWNMLCLHNYLMGNDNMDNFIGIYDKQMITELNKRHMKNISDIKDKLRYIEEVEDSTFLETFKCFCDTIWVITYTLSRYNFRSSSTNDLINNTIFILNKLLGLVKQSKLVLSSDTLKEVLFSYIYFNINSKEFKLQETINLDFLANVKVINDESRYKKGEFENYKLFEKICRNLIKKAFQVEKANNDLSGNLDLKYLLLPQYFYKLENKQFVIFINDPLDTLSRTFTPTGLTRTRTSLCKMLKLIPVELDYNELIEMGKTVKGGDLEALISDYLVLKLK